MFVYALKTQIILPNPQHYLCLLPFLSIPLPILTPIPHPHHHQPQPQQQTGGVLGFAWAAQRGAAHV
jgi:hypothetical protein